jgi:serine/threonine protein kinase
MPTPTTSDEFLELMRKSGIVDEKRLEPHVQKLRAEGRLPSDPTKLAGILVRDGLVTRFQAEQLLQGKWRRFTIGKYKVLERLGQGGMGSVYLCEHKVMRRKVAVKVLPTAKANDPSALERFYREARAVAALDHPNIVHAYDIDQDESLHFLVMEYVDGASLQDMVKRRGPLDPVRAAHYVHQAAQGLAHAHLAGLVHRDIKPGNLLVDRTGVVKLLDMGLARFFNDEEDILTRKYDESVLGTADYLSPEQATDSHEVDTRADIYSLGATFYYLLTGRTPFEEGTVAQKLLWHQTRRPKPVTTHRTDVPEAMLAVLDKMMEKRPEDRYQLPLQVCEALATWTQQPIAPPADSEMPRLSLAAVGPRYGSEAPPSTPTQKSGASSARRQWEISSPSSPTAPPSAVPKTPEPAPPAQSRAAEVRNKVPAVVPPTPARNAATANSPAPFLPTLPSRDSPNGTMNSAPVAPVETSPWDTLKDEEPAGESNQSPRSTPLVSKPRPPAAHRKKTLWLWIALVGVALLVLAAVIILWQLALHFSAAGTGPRPLRVLRDPSGKGGFLSIRQALKEARPGDVIELWETRHEESVVLDPRMGTTAVTLQAAPGKKVVWTCAKGSEKKPLLQLNKARDFQLHGDGIILDGQDKMPTLIQIYAQSPGLTLTGAQFTGFTEQAIHVVNCAGSQQDPVRLVDLTFAAPGGSKSRAVYFDANPKVFPPVNDFFEIHGCRFLGLSSRQGFVRKDASATGAHVQLPAGEAP